VARLPVPVVEFLTRIAILDDLFPELCAAVAGTPSAAEYLSLLARETPIVMLAEGKNWIRLHPLARDFALGRFEKLPQRERHELHAIAARWLAERESYSEAAHHALASGDTVLAQSLAERCLFGLIKEGRLGEVRAWLEKIPERTLENDIRMQLNAAWTMALGERPMQAQQITERA
jgi:LuxR family maltose regulon positive regulatory protein